MYLLWIGLHDFVSYDIWKISVRPLYVFFFPDLPVTIRYYIKKILLYLYNVYHIFISAI